MNDDDALQQQWRLISLLAQSLEDEIRHQIRFFETHISWVLVAGNFAYKFKKAVRFDFLDAAALEARRFYCEEELRLNRRLAPDIYLDVVPITGSLDQPVMGGTGTPIEYAVKMHAFEQHDMWNSRISRGLLTEDEVDRLATTLARFHQSIPQAPQGSAWGSLSTLHDVAADTFAQLANFLSEEGDKKRLEHLKRWETRQQHFLATSFKIRKKLGFIRECHGDLHSGNILTRNGQVEVFDCIDFNPELRWIDAMNDFAFIYLDLQFQGLRELSARLLNRYLEITGDYEGLSVLRYFRTHRALVRSKVAALRLQQLPRGTSEAKDCENLARKYLAFAFDSTVPQAQAIMITHGYSGSGKSTFSKLLVEFAGAVQVRSDTERKRLHGLPVIAAMPAPVATGIYHADATRLTYERLLALAGSVVEDGFPVIIDAAFLKVAQRTMFRQLASKLNVPFAILDLHASEAVLKARIASRQRLGQDPSDAGLDVLAHQLQNHDPLTPSELEQTLAVNVESGIDRDAAANAYEALQSLLHKAARVE